MSPDPGTRDDIEVARRRAAVDAVGACLSVPSVAAAGSVAFAGGRARATVPLGYAARELPDGSLVIEPPWTGRFTLRLAFDALATTDGVPGDIARAIVVDTAARKGCGLHRIADNGAIGFVEPGDSARASDPGTVRHLQGLVAIPDGLLVYELAVPERFAPLADVQAFVGDGGLERILGSVAARRA